MALGGAPTTPVPSQAPPHPTVSPKCLFFFSPLAERAAPRAEQAVAAAQEAPGCCLSSLQNSELCRCHHTATAGSNCTPVTAVCCHDGARVLQRPRHICRRMQPILALLGPPSQDLDFARVCVSVWLRHRQWEKKHPYCEGPYAGLAQTCQWIMSDHKAPVWSHTHTYIHSLAHAHTHTSYTTVTSFKSQI